MMNSQTPLSVLANGPITQVAPLKVGSKRYGVDSPSSVQTSLTVCP